MIVYKNIVRHDKLPFEQYLQLPGYSHSFLKYQRNGLVEYKEPTEKMKRGSMVDAILSGEYVDISHKDYQAAKHIAAQIKSTFGGIYHLLKFQQALTADMHLDGWVMPTTGRTDCSLPKRAVIDFKVTEATDLKPLVKFMGYDNQVWHYTNLEEVPHGYILAYSTRLKKALPLFPIPKTERNLFWEDAILNFGTVK